MAQADATVEADRVLSELVRLSGQLYSLPGVAVEVLQLTDQERVDTRQLKECIEKDPALTAKVLRTVNSSLFGLSREVGDLKVAVALLGHKPLKLLVLGFSLPESLFENITGEILGRYWKHTLTKAVAAREIAERFPSVSGDEAFLAGLLQDLGMLVLIQQLGDPYVALVDRVYAEGADLCALEREATGFEHSELSARLLEEWKLPAALVEAVRVKREGEVRVDHAPNTRPLQKILRLAELVASLLADRRVEMLAELLGNGEGELGVSQADLTELVERVQPTVEQLADILSLHLPDGLDYADVISEAHRQLAEVAADVAGSLVDRTRADEGSVNALVSEVRSVSAAVDRFLDAGASPALAAPPRDTARPPSGERTERAAPAAALDLGADDPALAGRLRPAVTAGWQNRWPVSLLLVELDRVGELFFELGQEKVDLVMRLLDAACRATGGKQGVALEVREGRCAVIVPDCDRQAAVRLGNQLLSGIKHLVATKVRGEGALISFSLGLATLAVPTKGFRAEDLIEAADRCLYAARLSGVSCLKSIEVY